MTTEMLSDVARVARRYRRSVRVDADLDATAIEGFVCPASAGSALLSMVSQRKAGQGAFTWTGPYGCGKSSLAVGLATLLSNNGEALARVRSGFGAELAARLEDALDAGTAKWRVVPVVGRRADPAELISAALVEAGRDLGLRKKVVADPSALVDAVVATAQKAGVRLLLLVDEMGKFLEEAASGGGDVYFFQMLAEAAARSDGHLLVIGILHQAFDDYAHRLAREARDEWLKIQGRYSDIPINIAGEEQIEMISRAIEADRRPGEHQAISNAVASAVGRGRLGSGEGLGDALHRCWPLHPATACVVGAVSRRRFGQNQRSIFGFLNSAEPSGFQEYLATTPADEVAGYGLPRLWAYLRANLEPSILASPDGHRWSLAVEAVSRCETKGGDATHLDLIKSIALLDLFREQSGLAPSREMLGLCLPGVSEAMVDAALRDLAAWSAIIFRRHLGAYSVFAGSDFDIDRAIKDVHKDAAGFDLGRVKDLAALQPVLAKRHYHATGALRWFDVDVCSAVDAADVVRGYAPKGGATGLFLLLLATNAETAAKMKRLARAAVDAAEGAPIVVGWARDSFTIREYASDLVALEAIRAGSPELRGDAVARREVLARIAVASSEVQERMRHAFAEAEWQWPASLDGDREIHVPRGPSFLSALASELADRLFPDSPQIPNEMLNRVKPSSNAVAAQRALLNAMVSRPHERRLGIDGWPAEAGLYVSILERTGLHGPLGDGFGFTDPQEGGQGRLRPLWTKADEIVRTAGSNGISGDVLYAQWRSEPFGVRDGLLPLLATAFYLSRADRLSVYLDGTFQPRLNSFFVDRLLQDPASVRLRWNEFSDLHRAVLGGLADLASEACGTPEPIDVARGLVSAVFGLEPWVMRTGNLSPDAERVRTLAKSASDPNKLLFDDLPALFGLGEGSLAQQGVAVAKGVRRGLDELRSAYPRMIDDLRALLLSELRVPTAPSEEALSMLRARAETVRGLTGDFRLDAFAVRLSTFGDSASDVEAIASLAANKPPRDWVDRDVDRARAEIALLSQQFVRAEALAHVKGREGRTAMAIVIGAPGRASPVAPAFDVSKSEAADVDNLAAQMRDLIARSGLPRNVALAALAETATWLAADESAEALGGGPKAERGRAPSKRRKVA